LRATANLSTGGIAVDRTDDIIQKLVWLAQRAAKIIGLDIAGIDIVTPDISRPWEMDGVIVEVNALPDSGCTLSSRGILAMWQERC